MRQMSWQKRIRWQLMTSRPPGQGPKQVTEQPRYTAAEKATCERKRRYPDGIPATPADPFAQAA